MRSTRSGTCSELVFLRVRPHSSTPHPRPPPQARQDPSPAFALVPASGHLRVRSAPRAAVGPRAKPAVSVRHPSPSLHAPLGTHFPQGRGARWPSRPPRSPCRSLGPDAPHARRDPCRAPRKRKLPSLITSAPGKAHPIARPRSDILAGRREGAGHSSDAAKTAVPTDVLPRAVVAVAPRRPGGSRRRAWGRASPGLTRSAAPRPGRPGRRTKRGCRWPRGQPGRARPRTRRGSVDRGLPLRRAVARANGSSPPGRGGPAPRT